mgnify:CR=1 FL=1
MKHEIKISLPLEVYYSKNKKFILNLNNYRNAYYTYYSKTKRRIDISNPCSIIDKFACDALVKAGIIKDDSFEQVQAVVYKFGGFDKENPRCELIVSL